jgi:hypothetical protein
MFNIITMYCIYLRYSYALNNIKSYLLIGVDCFRINALNTLNNNLYKYNLLQ